LIAGAAVAVTDPERLFRRCKQGAVLRNLAQVGLLRPASAVRNAVIVEENLDVIEEPRSPD
jgi:hypothetical protein